MTCIAAIAHEGRVYMAGDSAGLSENSWDLALRADPKVFRKGDMLIGFTSSYRMGQLLRFALEIPPLEPEQPLVEYMSTTLVQAVRECLKEHGAATTEEGADMGGTFLVGIQGRLFFVGDDFQVGEMVDPFAAVGCGSQIALGALYAITEMDDEGPLTTIGPIAALQLALEAAERYSAGVRGPFVVESL